MLHTPHGSVETPFFCVVGTAGSVKGVTPAELRELGAGVLLANTYHLFLRPGRGHRAPARRTAPLHGLGRADRHRQRRLSGVLAWLRAWSTASASRSACFPATTAADDRADEPRGQAARLVRVDEDGATFTSHIDGSRQRLTPEVSIAVQEALGADIMLAFDEPTSPLHDATYTARRWSGPTAGRRAVWRRARVLTRRCTGSSRAAPSRSCERRAPSSSAACRSTAWRSAARWANRRPTCTRCCDWSFPQLPERWPRHLLGIGEPEDLFAVRRARHRPVRLRRADAARTPRAALHARRDACTSPGPSCATIRRRSQADCGCYTCRTGFSRGYLRHLFAANELLAYTLASLHNLYFILGLMASIRAAIRATACPSCGTSFFRSTARPSPPAEAKLRPGLDHRGRVEDAVEVGSDSAGALARQLADRATRWRRPLWPAPPPRRSRSRAPAP